MHLKQQVYKNLKLCKKLCQRHYVKKSFFMVYNGMYDCHENIKIQPWSANYTAIDHDTEEILNYKKKMIKKCNNVLQIVGPLLLFYLLTDTK